MTARAALTVVAVFICAAACESAPDTDRRIDEAPNATPSTRSYLGPLDARDAARKAIECINFGRAIGGPGSGEPYDNMEVLGSPELALQRNIEDQGLEGPRSGYHAERREPAYALFTYRVAGRAKAAAILHFGPGIEGRDGWYVESHARCDYSDFPREVTDQIGIQVWADAKGFPVSTKRISSWRGPEHCNWQESTILTLGEDVYWRRPPSGLSERFFDEPYDDASRPLPADAVATDYERDGRQLWLSRDLNRAYVGNAGGVEVWPREKRELRCD